jgi:hypothetical protein
MMCSDFITWDMVNGWGEISGILQSTINSWYKIFLKRNSNCSQQCYIGIPFVDERMCMIDKPNFIWHCNILNFVEKSNVPTLKK